MCRFSVNMTLLRLSNIFFLLFLSYFFTAEVTTLEGSYFFYQQPEYPRDCKEVHWLCSSNQSSGAHTIKPDGYSRPFEVYCDNNISPGGWTVIQRQLDGSLTFNRNWEDYRSGFGFLSGEFYIGNDKLSYLTNQAAYELRIDMTLSNGSHFYVKYNSFRISDEWSQYAIVNAEEFSGNASCVATSCPTNMVHESCTCLTSCGDPIRMTDCREVCEETCVPTRCFVTDTNSFILEGESYMAPDCSQNCSCTDGQLICDNSYMCDPNAVCERRNNGLQCYCNEGYLGNGVSCVSICQANKVYGTCTCQKSCRNPNGCVPCNQGKRCYCPNGFYLQGEDCVLQEECGCFIDGNILQNGETYVNSNCSRKCSCSNDQLSCNSNYECSPNAACRVESGVRQCYCNAGYEGDGETCTPIYTDCNDVQNAGHTRDGVYSIRPTGWSGSSFNVFCNMTIDGGGWTVFQRRMDGATNFYRNWASYRNGFGNIQNDFWLGNEKLYYLTNQATYEIRVDYVSSSYASYYDKYARFSIDNEVNKYRIKERESHSGNGNSLDYTKNKAFSTYDQDNDGLSYDCAEKHRSGWWHGGYYNWYYYSYCHYWPDGSRYRRCSYNNLNGDYNGGNGQNIFVYYYYYRCNIKYTEMKIRRAS